MEAIEVGTEVTKQVIFTSSHPLEDCPLDKRLIFLTEVTTGNMTTVKVLCDQYVHIPEDPAYTIRKHDAGTTTNILILELHQEVMDLMRSRIQECNSDEKEFQLDVVDDENEPKYTSVSKRGHASGITHGDVIARELHLQGSSQQRTASAGFAVGSKSVTSSQDQTRVTPFGTRGDSGSLAFEKVDQQNNVLILRAHGIVWKKIRTKNNHTQEWDNSATFCARLNPNLKAIEGKPYRDFQFPDASPSETLSFSEDN